MGFVGLEEIFLKVQDLDQAIDFYHNKLGIPLDKHDQERAYLQCDRGHVVLQIENSTGRHQAGGPMHFAFTVTEETFDEVVKKFVGSEYRTRGPIDRKEPFKGRALFIFDPDGNETEVNTR
jgi:catechol-2,3-dioxygenase